MSGAAWADFCDKLKAAGAAIQGETTPEDATRRFLAANPQHRHGRHAYKLEDFGLDRKDVSQRFTTYRERFDIPDENPEG